MVEVVNDGLFRDASSPVVILCDCEEARFKKDHGNCLPMFDRHTMTLWGANDKPLFEGTDSDGKGSNGSEV